MDFSGPEWDADTSLVGGRDLRQTMQRARELLKPKLTATESAQPAPSQQQTLTGVDVAPEPIRCAPVRLKTSAVTMRQGAPAPTHAGPRVQQPAAIGSKPLESTNSVKVDAATSESDARARNLAEARSFLDEATKSRPDTRHGRVKYTSKKSQLLPTAPLAMRFTRSTQPARIQAPPMKPSPTPNQAETPVVRPAGWVPPHKLASMAAQANKTSPASPAPASVRDAIKASLSIEAMKALRPQPAKADLPQPVLPATKPTPAAPSPSSDEQNASSTPGKDKATEAPPLRVSEAEKQSDNHARTALYSAVADFVAKDDKAPSSSPHAFPTPSPAAANFVARVFAPSENKPPSAALPTSYSSTSCSVPQTVPIQPIQRSHVPNQTAYQEPLLSNFNYQAEADAMTWPLQNVQHPVIPSMPPSFSQVPTFPTVPPGFSPIPAYAPMAQVGPIHGDYTQQAQSYYTAPPVFSPIPAYAPPPDVGFPHVDYFDQAHPYYSTPIQRRATSFTATPQPHQSVLVQRRAASSSISKAIPIVKPPTTADDNNNNNNSKGMLLSFLSDSERVGGGSKVGIEEADDVAAVGDGNREASVSNTDTLVEVGGSPKEKAVLGDGGDADSLAGEASNVGSQSGVVEGVRDTEEDVEREDPQRSIDQQTKVGQQEEAGVVTTTENLHSAEYHQTPPSKIRHRARKAAREALNDAWQVRELARTKLAGAYSLENAKALQGTTRAYNDQRNELATLMHDGELNDEDACIFPFFSKLDTTQPKVTLPNLDFVGKSSDKQLR
jgi:hypothetical protein